MAKSKKQTQVRLSPEAYIRKKARNLPLHECLINSDWKETGMAQIIVSRQHTNGNITFGVYLTDIFCVGVKETFFNFNVDISEYEELVEQFSNMFEMFQVDYALIHNIIYASVDYARDLGIEPHKDFGMITQFLLEEDTDDVEWMEIECGKEGQPFFVITNFYTPAQARIIINQLEKAVGKGNFVVTTEHEQYDEKDDDVEDFETEYDFMTPEERKTLFLDLIDKEGKPEIFIQLLDLTDSICMNDVCNWDMVEEFRERWEPELKALVNDDEFSTGMIGTNYLPEHEEVNMELIKETMNAIMNNDEDAEDKLRRLKASNENLPYLYFMELNVLKERKKQEEYANKLEQYMAKFPDYILLKMESIQHKLKTNVPVGEHEIAFEYIFEGRKSVTDFEMFLFQSVKQMYYCQPNAFDAMQALYEHYEDLEMGIDGNSYKDNLEQTLVLNRLNYLKAFFESRT